MGPSSTEGPPPRVHLITGGQTGADRAAFDVAREFELSYGGWVPRGRRDESGTIPAHFEGLHETRSADVEERTRRNVRDCDALLVVSHGPLRGGTAVARSEAELHGRPVLALDLTETTHGQAARHLGRWLSEQSVRGHRLRLNVAGARASEDPAIYPATYRLLVAALQLERRTPPPTRGPG